MDRRHCLMSLAMVGLRRTALVSPAETRNQVLLAQPDDQKQFAKIKAFFENENPGLRMTIVKVDGETSLRTDYGGMRVFWLYRGQGEILLPKGYRTQEGDGQPLPEEYRADKVSRSFAETLRVLKEGLSSVKPAANVPVGRILRRCKGDTFIGNFANDLWQLEHCPRPWSTDEELESRIASLFGVYRVQGYSTKEADTYEALVAGDQVVACGEEEIRVRGGFVCLALENVRRSTSHISTARRLKFLMDCPGGCNPDFDPFRRLPLTWYMNYPDESSDGLNWVNSHVVNIPEETSPTHFHPPKSLGSPGLPQREMYLTLDPRAWQLNTWGRSASLIVYPDLGDLRRHQEYHLVPGTLVYIPPGTGHRGLDVFVNVLTIPGFKPHNEYYIDQDIRDSAGGTSPYNENLPAAKNYGKIEDLL